MTATLMHNIYSHCRIIILHSYHQGVSPPPALLPCKPLLSYQAEKADHGRLDSTVNILEWRSTKLLDGAKRERENNFRCD